MFWSLEVDWKRKLVSEVSLNPGGRVPGQVLDRDAQHRPSTRNVTRVKKGGSKLYILPNYDEK